MICYFSAQETFHIILSVKMVEKIICWIESSNEQHLIEIEIFCKDENVFFFFFLVNFDTFIASLLNKSINLLNLI